jgi:hypothetical protein
MKKTKASFNVCKLSHGRATSCSRWDLFVLPSKFMLWSPKEIILTDSQNLQVAKEARKKSS